MPRKQIRANPKKRTKKTQQQVPQLTKKVKELGLLARGLRAAGAAAGGFAGSAFGMPVAGAQTGSNLGAAISRWLGAGDYELTKNSVTSAKQVPGMHHNNESIVVRHREYICDIKTSSTIGAFSSTQLSLNPGLRSTFPWLAAIAQQYQEYSMKGVVFHFVSLSGDSVGSTTTTLPSVMMATQYRAGSTPFTDKQTMLNEYYSTDAKASESFVHPIECDPKENPYNVQYIRTGAVPTGEDIKTYDIGTFTIATSGCQAASVVVGELWITYEIELKKPLSAYSKGITLECAHYNGVTATTTNRLGLTQTLMFDNIGLTFVTGNTIVFPTGLLGYYQVQLWWPATTNTGATVPVIIPTNCTLVQRYANAGDVLEYATSTGGFTAGGPTCNTIINITNPTVQAQITLTAITLTGTNWVDILVNEVNPSV